MCSMVSYNNDLATLTIYDGEKDEKLSLPRYSAKSLAKRNRYSKPRRDPNLSTTLSLPHTALEIAENDAVD